MEFRRKLTSQEVIKYNLDVFNIKKDVEWWWVTVFEDDLKHKIHVFSNRKRLPRRNTTWQKISKETCLENYSKILLELEFKFNDKKMQDSLTKIKKMSENLVYDKLFDTPWIYIANDKDGPFTIIGGNHRQLAVYIVYFIFKKNSKFRPIQHALCALPSKGKSFGRLIDKLC